MACVRQSVSAGRGLVDAPFGLGAMSEAMPLKCRIRTGEAQPDGQITSFTTPWPVQSALQKYSDFQKPQISLYPRHPVPHRGALRNVTNAGRDAVDADGAPDEGA